MGEIVGVLSSKMKKEGREGASASQALEKAWYPALRLS